MPSLGLGLYLGASALNTGGLVAPAGFAFLVDDDGAYLVDDDGYYLIGEI